MPQNVVARRISYRQYKLFDLLVFLIILIVFELINIFAIERWFTRQLFSLSVMLLVTMVVMIRWGYLSVILPVADGILYCLMYSELRTWGAVTSYAVGNAFVVLACLLFLIKPKKFWTSRWYLTLVYAVVGYVLLVLGRTLVSLFFGESFLNGIIVNLENEFFNLFFAVAGLLVLRRFNPMLEDQKEYIRKMVEDREKPKHPDEYRWEGYTELDEDELKKLQEMNDYDRAVYYNAQYPASVVKENVGEDDESDLSKLDG